MAMDGRPAEMELQGSRALAHKLYGQCRDSTSAYKLLTPSVRKLRNLLEEVEESFEDGSTLGPYEIRVLKHVGKCHAILGQLDLLLSSKAEPDGIAVADLKTALDVANHELSVAYEALSNTAKIELRLDTASLAQARSISLKSASVSATSDVARKLSTSSSGWSFVNADSSGRSSITDVIEPLSGGGLEVQPSEEKEALAVSNTARSATQRVISPWHSIFADDPMSVPIDQASAFILSDEMDPPEAATNTTPLAPAAERSASIIQPVKLAKVAGVDEGSELGAQSVETIHSMNGVERSEPDAASDESVALTQETLPSSDDSLAPDSSRDGSPMTIGDSGRSRAVSEATISGEDVVETEAREAAVAIDDTVVLSHSPQADDIAVSEDCADVSPLLAEPASASAEQARSGSVVELVDGAVDDTTQTASTPSEAFPSMPQPPRRAPPPPPPPPPAPRRRLRTASSSRYMIANLTPSDTAPEEDSDDELYASSIPASPARDARNIQLPPSPAAQTRSPSVPQLHINGSACEEIAEEADAWQRTATEFSDSSTSKPSPDIEHDAAAATVSSTSASPPSSTFSDDNGLTKQVSPDTEEQPPPLPKRPVRYHSQRSALIGRPPRPSRAVSTSSATSIIRPKSEAGLQVNTGLGLRHHKSTDEALNVDPASGSAIASTKWQARSRSRSELDHTQLGTGDGHRRTQSAVVEFYGGSAPNSDPDAVDFDTMRVQHIVQCFNDQDWARAESYLEAHLERMIERDDITAVRRARHLLGVCAAYRGNVQHAISLFIGVLQTPIKEVAALDDGDCAAAYWLGDAYAMLNRRTEALLSYCLAGRSSLFQHADQTALRSVIVAEQQSCQLGVSKADFRLRWAREASHSNGASWSLYNPDVVSDKAAQAFLNDDRKPDSTASALVGDQARWSALSYLDSYTATSTRSSAGYRTMKISPNALQPDSPWPMIYDPVFCMTNVAHGRLLAYECNIADIFKAAGSERVTKMLKRGPLGLSRADCFTCDDLHWLISAVRDSLRTLNMAWSEVANVEGTWFVVRRAFIQESVAQTHYFSIAFFRQSFQNGYGVQICPDGVRAARLVSQSVDTEHGVSATEPRRLQKLIREQLEQAWKGRYRVSSLRPSMEMLDRPPPLPPRPRTLSAAPGRYS